MKNNLIPVSLLLTVLLFNQCEKNGSDPNENWVVGRSWIDTRDNNSYNTVPIGDQIWMAENLAYLPSVNNVADGSEDEGQEQKSFYYVYDYDGTDVAAAKATSYYEQYGVLYNWIAAKNACPDGWHLPTDDEWKELERYLGISATEVDRTGYRGTDQGSRLKSTWGWGYFTWVDKYGNGTNETGFTGLPGGDRYLFNEYSINGAGSYGFWWSSTESTDNGWIWYRSLFYTSDKIYRSITEKHEAKSVRCIKTVN